MTAPVKKLVYISTARLPTEKAHGYQICKMCEAFGRSNVAVTLLHPFRHQPPALAKAETVFSYYAVQPVFTLQTLKNFDVFRLERLLPGFVFRCLFVLHALVWGWYAAGQARRLNADIYYTRDITVAFWLTLAGMPAVFEVHDIPRGMQQWFLKKTGQRKSLRQVFVLTAFLKERLAALGFPADHILVLPDAVDINLFSAPATRQECRRQLGLPQEAPVIGYIGRFTTMGMEKGIATLVEAMKFAAAAGEEQLLLLCVGGPMDVVPRYQALGRRLGIAGQRLRFIDRVPTGDVPRWIRACDLVTIPWPWNEFSAYYTSPMKLFEYMASGVPIVASDLPSLREVLRHGENSWLVQPGDPAGLAAGIVRLLRDPEFAGSLAQTARTEAVKYTWQQRAATVLSQCFQDDPPQQRSRKAP